MRPWRPARVVLLDTEIALAAAEACRAHKLVTADAIVFATARARGAALLTCDTHFKDLPGVTLKRSRPEPAPVVGVDLFRQLASIPVRVERPLPPGPLGIGPTNWGNGRHSGRRLSRQCQDARGADGHAQG